MSDLLSLEELCAAIQTDRETVEQCVHEGVIAWTRDGERQGFRELQLFRVRRILRIQRDFELELGAAALVVELLDELTALRGRVRVLEHLGAGPISDA